MRRMARDSGYRAITGTTGLSYCPVFLTFDVNPNGVSEVPTFCEPIAEATILKMPEPGIIVTPLPVDANVRNITGAETILKHFSRNNLWSGRIGKVTTPKNEVYYGGPGIVLDKDFSPLMLSTTKVTKERETVLRGQITIHMSPKVFTDDVSIVNRSLARKGVAYYLSNGLSRYALDDVEGRAKVVIDDMSNFFKKVAKPDVNASPDTYQTILKENLDEVLKQFYNDMSYNL